MTFLRTWHSTGTVSTDAYQYSVLAVVQGIVALQSADALPVVRALVPKLNARHQYQTGVGELVRHFDSCPRAGRKHACPECPEDLSNRLMLINHAKIVHARFHLAKALPLLPGSRPAPARPVRPPPTPQEIPPLP